MQNIKDRINELIDIIDELSISTYVQARDTYFKNIEWENSGADGLLSYTYNEELNEEEEYIQEQTDEDTTNYFFTIQDIVRKEITKSYTISDKLIELGEVEKTWRAENCFDYSITKIRKQLEDTAIKLNSIIDEPVIRLQRLKELEYVDIIDTKDFEFLFNITERSQATWRKRSKNRLPSIGGGKGGNVLYSKKISEEFIMNSRNKNR